MEETENAPVVKEKEPNPFENTGFFVTDHSADRPNTGNPDTLRKLYKDVKSDGIEAIRFDWRWKNVQPASSGGIDPEASERYKNAISIMQEVGLEAPTVNLSSIPDWAVELYSKDKESFFAAWDNYLDSVKTHLQETPGMRVSRFQVLNELNVGTYTPIKDVEDIGRMCDAVREKFTDYNPDLKISVSLLSAELPDSLKGKGFEDINSYLEKFEKIKDKVDIVTLDTYPGSWQRFKRDRTFLENLRHLVAGTEQYKEMFRDLEVFKNVAGKVASWNKEYEIGETGFPVKTFWGDERRQRYFYDVFMRELKHTVVGFRERGIGLPSRVGLYQAISEEPRDLREKLLKLTPYPEFNWGMRNEKGERKLILQGYEGEKKASRLSDLIHYFKSPLEKRLPIPET